MSDQDLRDAWQLAHESIGRRVRASVSSQAAEDITGRLLALDDEGEFRIEHDSGAVSYCWPLLGCELLPTCTAESSGQFWPISRCEKAPGHDRGHCDLNGRTW